MRALPPTLFWIVSSLSLAAARADGVTYGHDVAPILERHCTSCHRAGGSMPQLPLDGYESARAATAPLLAAVTARTMPPWFADPNDSAAFRNDPRLSDTEISVLTAWVKEGAMRGGLASVAPSATDGWLHPDHRRPDAVVSFPRIDLPANGELPYVRILIKVPLSSDRWIEALQALPGNPAVVHHMAIAEVTLPAGVTPQTVRQLDEVARKAGLPEGAFTRVQPAVVDPTDTESYDMLAAYTPGSTFESYPQGVAKLLKGGGNDYINFNIHYTTTGKPEADQSRIGLWFTPHAPKRQIFRAPMPGKTLLANGKELLTDTPGTKAEGTDFAIPPIPAFEPDFELTGITAVLRPLTIHALQPHAHLRGSSFRYLAVWPDGRTQTLLSIPRYDFHWQLTYQLRTPVTLPVGSKIIASGRYDNSSHNKHLTEAALADPAQRCGPDKIVHFRPQNQTWDEMFSPIVEYSVDRVATGPKARLIRATGCIVPGPAHRWVLGGIGQLEATRVASSSAAELAEMTRWPEGAQSRPILAAQPFDLERESGHRVAVKAMEVGDDRERGLSLTSLQRLEGACHPGRADSERATLRLPQWPAQAGNPDFHLIDTQGRARTLEDFRGRVTIVYFGFVSCPDICPATLHKLALAGRVLGRDAQRLQVVFVTLDPEHDTPAQLDAYVRTTGLRTTALTGTPARIDEAARAFAVQHARVVSNGAATIDHSGGLFIFDSTGRLRLVAPVSVPVADLAHDLGALR